MGAIATKILPANRHAVFWAAAFVTLLIPPTWVSILRGYPDLGAAVIIGLAILVYFKDVKLQSWWQIPLIGFLLALAILFRRHFAYSSRAFLIAMLLQGFLVFLNEVRGSSRGLKKLAHYTFLIVLIGLSSLATQALLAPNFLYDLLTTNFRSLYASYESSFSENFQYYGQAYGWLIWLLTILGFSAGTLTRILIPSKTSFILIFGCISLIQWGLLSRQLSVHYTTQFTCFVALGLTALLWTTWLILKKKARILMLVLVISLITSNAVIGLTSLGIFENSIRPFFSTSHPPLFRKDYDEIHRLIDYLAQLNLKKKPIFVAASSTRLNDSLLEVAQQQIYRKKFLEILDTPDIDSRDYYPLDSLLKAQYVVIATPFQYHLPPQEQDVVKVVVDAFTESWNFSQDFRQLPEQFNLEEGVKVIVYERIRPTSSERILQTIQLMQQRIQPKPLRQGDWMVFSQNQSGKIDIQPNGATTLQAVLTTPEPTSFLYFGLIPKKVKINGEITGLKCTNASKLVIRLAILNQQGKPINTTESLVSSATPTPFSLSLPRKDAAYFLLNLINQDTGNTSESCSIDIQNVNVSESTLS